MKKVIIYGVSILIIVVLIVGIYIFFNKSTSSESIKSGNNDLQQNILNDISNTSIINNETITNIISNNISDSATSEQEIANFTTKLSGDSARLNNVSLTCNTINGTIIHSGETFSFNQIVGQPTKEKGYEEADVFVNKKTEKGYGGGNCQVSTTIYNAVLQVSGLTVIERHPHKKNVSYIEEGKDAAVSYSGGLDFSFRNDTDKSIKIYVSSGEGSLNVKIAEF